MSMSTPWISLRSKLAGKLGGRRTIALQHLMLSDRDMGTVRAVLDRVGARLGVKFELQGHAGEIVLVDGDLAAHVSPQLVLALAEERPVVTIAGLHRGDDLSLSAAELLARRQRELLAQLEAIPLVRQRCAGQSDSDDGLAAPGGPASGFDSKFDSRFVDAAPPAPDAPLQAQHEVLRAVMRGALDPKTPAFTASYGPGAQMRFDFRARLVTIDPLAQEHLRLRRELPRPAPGERPQPHFSVRELDLTLWDLGLAAASLAPLDAPADWWHARLVGTPAAEVERYSRAPGLRDLARRLQAGPATPSELRRQARVGVSELRGFLQACLLLRLAHWQGTSSFEGAAS
jgi:hypothetical protein